MMKSATEILALFQLRKEGCRVPPERDCPARWGRSKQRPYIQTRQKYIERVLVAVIIYALFAPISAGSTELYSKGSFSLDLSGYMQDQAQHTRDFLDEPYDQNQLRLRTEFNAESGSRFYGVFSHTFEINSGSALRSQQYQALKDLPPQTYYDWDWTMEDNDRRHVRHSIYRAYLVYEKDEARIVGGRQRVAWGTALFWNPTDLFNPVSPISLEPMEKEGVDGLSAELSFGEFTYLNLVHGIGDDYQGNTFAGRLKTTIKSFDVSVMGGKFMEDRVAGADFSGYVKKGSLYGEGTYTWAEDRDDFLRFCVGYQYSWPNSATLVTEYYHNGGNIDWEFELDIPIEDLMPPPGTPPGVIEFDFDLEDLGLDFLDLVPEELFSDPLATFGRNFLGVSAGIDITPLVRYDTALILDIDNKGLFIGPHVSYLATGALTVEGGAQLFGGDADGEYSWMHDIFWIRLRYDLA